MFKPVILKVLDFLGLRGVAHRFNHFLIVRGYGQWEPLIPEAEFEWHIGAALDRLLPVPLAARLLPVRPNLMAFRRQQLESNPYPETYRYNNRVSYTLPQAQWPPEIQDAWHEYRTRCGVRIRETSFASYLTQMRMYLGYFVNVQGFTPTLDDLFNRANLTTFVRWPRPGWGGP